MAFDILELPQIPRERDKLKGIIGAARYQRQKSRMMRFASYGMIGLASLLLMLHGCSTGGSAPTSRPATEQALYLPIVQR